MKPRLSAMLGVVVGLVLAVGLLYPDADRDELTAQGVTALLGADLAEAFPDGTLEAERLPEASVFAALAAALDAGDDPAGGPRTPGLDDAPRVMLSVRLDGAPADDPAFARAFATNLNLFNAARAAGGLPQLALAPDAPLHVRLDVRRDDERVSLTADLLRTGADLAITPTACRVRGPTPGAARCCRRCWPSCWRWPSSA